MPSQRYDPPHRDDDAGQRPDQTASMPAQEQPGQWTPPPTEPTPDAQSRPEYGAAPAFASAGAPPAYDGGRGWSQSVEPSGQSPYPDGADSQSTDSDAVRAREKEAFGGVKVGAAFFGWLTAVGATVILVALVAAVASALDLGTVVDGGTSSQDLRSVGIGAAIVVLVVLFLAYYCGGYVAGRMARFNGVRQGVAVWLWAVLIAAAVTGIGLLADSNSNLVNELNLPNIALDSGDMTRTGLIALGVVLVVTLIGAIVGGLAGMRFHRRVDRAGFAPDPY